MTKDGADLGITADRALDTVLGGKPHPTEEEEHTPEQMLERLMSRPRIQDIEMRIEKVRDSDDGPEYDGEVLYASGEKIDFNYDSAAETAARAVYEFIQAYPEWADAPIENVYADDADWSSPTVLKDSLRTEGLYEHMRGTEYDLGKLGLSGFMWGWAYNTAHYCMNKPTQPNPAIITIGG